MKKTGAKLVWASTTPIPDDPARKQTAASIVERNRAAAQIMQKYGIVVDDLFTAVTPHLKKMQNPNDVHFNADGYEFLGQRVGEAILEALKLGSGQKQLPHAPLPRVGEGRVRGNAVKDFTQLGLGVSIGVVFVCGSWMRW
jgi:hypothetical protein